MTLAPGHVLPLYRKDIDGLRAVAILLVVAFHVGLPGMRGGYIGVDVFFVISGYLITSLLVAEALATGKISLLTFYARRVRRLFPALFVVVLATLMLARFFLLPTSDEQVDVAHSAIAASLYVANAYFLHASGQYFDAATALMPLVHTWSLSVEEQFYVFWPLLILAVLWLGRRRQIGFQTWLAAAYLGVLLFSFALGAWATGPHPRAAFYLMPSRAWEFAAGGLLALLLPKSLSQYSRLGAVLATAGLAMILAAAATFDTLTPIPGVAAALPVGGACLLIAGGSMSQRAAVYRLLTLRPIVYIGLLSYSWYLWHWPLLAITRVTVLQEPNLLRDAGLAAVALGAAHFTYQLVENPIRTRWAGVFRANWMTLAAGLVLTVASIAIAGGLQASATSEAAEHVAAGPLSQAALDSGGPRECRQQPPFSQLVPRAWCTVGDPSKPIRAVTWGDSHAAQYYPLIKEFVENRPQIAILQRTFMGCTPIGVTDTTAKKAGAADERSCEEYNATVLREITALRATGLQGVVLSGRWLEDFGAERVSASRLSETDQLLSGEQQAQQMWVAARRFADLLGRLDELGLKILVIAPLAEMRYDIPKCLARREPGDCSVPRAIVDQQRYATLLAMHDVLSQFPRAMLLDPLELLCDTNKCFAQRDGVVLYSDDNHLTVRAAERLLPTAYGELAWLTGLETHYTVREWALSRGGERLAGIDLRMPY